MRTDVELQFGDGFYLFRLNLPQLQELQIKCGSEGKPAGVGEVFGRLLRARFVMQDGTTVGNHEDAVWMISDIYEPIRLGLEGGASGLLGGTLVDGVVVGGTEVKVTPMMARQMADRFVLGEQRMPFKDSWATAASIMTACVVGYEDPGKKAAPVKKNDAMMTEGGSITSEP